MDFTYVIGLFGAVLAGIAYLPQIIHLVNEKCSAGISQRAYILWLIASVALLFHAITLKSFIFILLSSIQVVSTFLIIFFSNKYKGTCTLHEPLSSKKN